MEGNLTDIGHKVLPDFAILGAVLPPNAVPTGTHPALTVRNVARCEMANSRTLVLALGVSALFAGATAQLMAQAGRGDQAPAAPARVVGLVGCLERLPPPAGRAGQAAPAAGPAFRLTNVHAADAPPAAGERVGTPPPAGGRPPLVVEQEYLVVAAEPVKLADHVNTRVEVTGTLGAVPETAPSQPQRGEVKPAAPSRITMITVTAIKPVSSECK